MKADAEAANAESFHFLTHHASSWSPDGIGINWFKGPIYDIWNHLVVATNVIPGVTEMTSFGFQSDMYQLS